MYALLFGGRGPAVTSPRLHLESSISDRLEIETYTWDVLTERLKKALPSG